jgi:hypothetical protein
MPGASTDLATMNSVSPATALPRNASSRFRGPGRQAPRPRSRLDRRRSQRCPRSMAATVAHAP